MSSTEPGSLPTGMTRVRRFDRVCDEFEAAWRAGETPQLEDFLARVAEDLSPELFGELLALELGYRSDRGLSASADDYERRFPDLRQEISYAFERHGSTQKRVETVGSSRGADLQLPARLGDYELLGEIGRGGMGIVFKARQVSLDRIVALKIIRGNGLLGDETVLRFQKEARAAARLQHPGIVHVHDVGADGPFHFFSMEYVEGETLSAACGRVGLSSQEAARFLVMLCEAVEYAHDQGILHRDLKPSNVLVDRSGRLRIADFGLAKQFEGAGTLTSMGQILGTPAYMPPEQARGGQNLDRRSDVYSLGAILYALLTGRPPFLGLSPIDTLVQVIHDQPRPPRERNPQVDAALESICLKCLSKDPAGRFPSAAALRIDLERYLAGGVLLERSEERGAKRDERTVVRSTLFALRLIRSRTLALIVTVAFVLAATAMYLNRKDQNAPDSTAISSGRQLEDAVASPAVIRQPRPGDGDPSFGVEGLVQVDFGRGGGGRQEAYSLALQPDGCIIAGGAVQKSRAIGADFMALARLVPDGASDLSFNKSGRSVFWFGNFDDEIRDVAVDSEGKIVICGLAEVSAVGYDFALARFNPDGSGDPTFGGQGMVTTNVTGTRSSHGQRLSLQSDGKIVAAGNATTEDGKFVFALVRYLPDGSLDPEFGQDGRVTSGATYKTAELSALAIDEHDRIIMLGRINDDAGLRLVTLRYSPDGTADESFGAKGIVAFDSATSSADRLVLQGKRAVILAVHETGCWLTRLNEDGSTDGSFGDGGDGRTTTDFPVRTYVGFDALADGALVIADPYARRLAVYSPDGLPQAVYAGGDDDSKTPPPAGLAVRNMVRAPDGKLIFCGKIATGEETSQFAILRLLGPPLVPAVPQ